MGYSVVLQVTREELRALEGSPRRCRRVALAVYRLWTLVR